MDHKFVIKKGMLLKYTGPGGHVAIPEEVTKIELQAFRDCTSLTGVTIPAGVTEIGWFAFEGCTNLTSVSIPEGVTEIGWSAFSGCTGLTGLTLPDSMTEIGTAAFSGCTGLTSVAIPAGVKEIGMSAFSNCTGLTSVSIPEGVTKIGNQAFWGCTGLTSVSIPESVTEIGAIAFEGCTGLTNVTVPERVVEIGRSAFAQTPWQERQKEEHGIAYAGRLAVACQESLTHAEIRDGTERFGDGAFADCTNLLRVTIPDSVTEISWSAFEGCTGLTSVTIPAGVTSVCGKAFFGCTGLTSITIPASVTKIGWSAFEDCTGLTSITILGRPDICEGIFPHHDISIVAEQFRMGDYLTTAEKQAAARGFSLRYGSGEELPEAYRADCLKYIKGHKKKLYPLALQFPALLHVMLEENMVPKGELPDLIEQAAAVGSAEITAMLLEYQEKQLKPGERQKLEEKKMRQKMDFMLTGTLPVGEAKKNWRYEKDEEGDLTILGYKGKETEVDVPSAIGKDPVTAIGKHAFSPKALRLTDAVRAVRAAITSVTLPDSVTRIGECAFLGCEYLTIHAPAGSYAETYAKENNIPFETE